MAILLVDVLGNGAAHPLVLLTQLAAGCHQQRNCVAHVVVSLRQKGEIGVTADIATATGFDNGGVEQMLTLTGSGLLQSLVEAHDDSPVRHWLICREKCW